MSSIVAAPLGGFLDSGAWVQQSGVATELGLGVESRQVRVDFFSARKLIVGCRSDPAPAVKLRRLSDSHNNFQNKSVSRRVMQAVFENVQC
jgi:hypothetical protein